MDNFSNVAAAAIGGSLAAASSLKGQKKQFQYQSKLNQQAFELNQRMQDYVYNQNLEQWQRENEYNSPSAQIARLAEAGLNPNLIYGSTDGGSAAHSPQLNAAEFTPPNAPNYGQAAGDAINAAMSGSQLANSMAQADFINAQTKKTLAEADKISHFNLYADEYYSAHAENETNRTAQIKASTSLIQANTKLSLKRSEEVAAHIDNLLMQYNILQKQNEFDTRSFNTRLAILRQTLSKMYVDIENAKKVGKNLDKDGLLKDATLKKIVANTYESYARTYQLENNPDGYSGELGNLFKLFEGVGRYSRGEKNSRKRLVFID